MSGRDRIHLPMLIHLRWHKMKAKVKHYWNSMISLSFFLSFFSLSLSLSLFLPLSLSLSLSFLSFFCFLRLCKDHFLFSSVSDLLLQFIHDEVRNQECLFENDYVPSLLEAIAKFAVANLKPLILHNLMAVVVESCKRSRKRERERERELALTLTLCCFLLIVAKRRQLFKKYNGIEIFSSIATNQVAEIASDAKQTLYILTWNG
jgi:hypothetical protein